MKDSLMEAWLAEEEASFVCGWDFSHLEGRCEEDPLPWDYRETVLSYLTPEMKLLDIDTGGGEFLRTLNHPPRNTAATEGYAPNVEFCRRELAPLGIDFRPSDGAKLPFSEASFDMVIDRHGDLNPSEIFRVLKPGGLFVTQQVGADNDRALVSLLMGDLPLPFPHQRLGEVSRAFSEVGFSILRGEEYYGRIRFFDVGALVWFAGVIPWEFPDFSVASRKDRLYHAQEILEGQGFLEGKTHRFLFVAQKPDLPLILHYDRLLAEGNDPVLDPPPLRAYMDRWDGIPFLEALGLTPASRVLEIGVGTGRLALKTVPLCGAFTGIDLAPETAEQARKHLASFSHAKVVCGDFLTYPFGETFDVIYSSLTFLHISRKEAAVKKALSLLSKGGRLILSLDKNREEVLGEDRLTVYPDDPPQICDLLRRYGGDVISVFEIDFATVIVARLK